MINNVNIINNFGGSRVAPTAPMMQAEHTSPIGIQPSTSYQLGVTEFIHKKTLNLLSQVSDISESIIHKPSTSSHSSQKNVRKPVTSMFSPINIDLSDRSRSIKMFNQETHVHHHYHRGETSNQQKDDTGTRVLVGLVGLVVASVMGYFISKGIAKNEEIKEENSNFEELKKYWSFNKNRYSFDYQSIVDHVVSKADAIVRRNQQNRIHNIALLVFGFIGGGTAITGALIGSNAVMLASAGIGAAVIIATFFKLGYSSSITNGNQKDAKAIEEGLDQLSRKEVSVIRS